MKVFKKALSILLIALTVIGITMTGSVVSAETNASAVELIKVAGKSVTSDMTAADLIRLFGAPKVETISHYGGKAYTFYNNNYSDHLFAATTSDGKIAEILSTAADFEIDGHKSGEKVNRNTLNYSNVYIPVKGTDLKKLITCSVFNYRNRLYYSSDENETFFSDPYTYNKALAPHAIAMVNAQNTLYGNKNIIKYDEDAYNRVLQLAENGNTPDDYAHANALDSYIQFCASGMIRDISLQRYSELLFNCKGEPVDLYAFMFFVDNKGTRRYYAGTIDKRLFENHTKTVDLTPDEKEKVRMINALLIKSRDEWNNAPAYYDVKPDFSSLPLEPGKINSQKLSGAVGYLNAIRAGADLPLLTPDEELCRKAQAKAVYIRYLAKNNYPAGHYPPKIDGISDEFYDLCSAAPGGENLYYGEALTSILHALDDTVDNIERGHRHNLLSPRATKIGVGCSSEKGLESQGVHEMGSGAKNPKPLVSWPSIGVTPYSAISRNDRWTIQSHSADYTFANDTYITTKLLNTGEIKKISTGTNDLVIRSRILSFKNIGLPLSPGYVYEVTIHNIRNSSGAAYDYTYRSVIMNDSMPTETSVSVSLDKTKAEMKPNSTLKLHGILSVQGESPYTVTWTSSDPSVVSVNSCGELTAHRSGTAVITAEADKSSAYCTVTVSGSSSPSTPSPTEHVADPSENNMFNFTVNSDSTVKLLSYNGKDVSVKIPAYFRGKKVTSISDSFLINSGAAIASVTLPETVTDLGALPLRGNKLKIINVSANNAKYTGIGGILYTKDMKTIVKYPSGRPFTLYTVPNGITTIGAGAFYGVKSLMTVIIPDTVKSIGNYAFMYCDKLNGVELPGSVSSIGIYAFANCSSLDKLTVNYKNAAFKNSVFDKCEKLTLIGYKGSTTETYAKNNRIPFKAITEQCEPPVIKLSNVANGVKITWNKVSGAEKYRVFYHGTKGWTKLTDTTGTSFIDADVASNHRYTYSVRCISADGKTYTGDYSTNKSITFYAAPSLTLKNVADGVKISWKRIDGAAKYRVYYKSSNGWTKICDTASDSAVYTNVASGTTYTFTIRALDKNGKHISDYYHDGFKIKFLRAPSFTLSSEKNGVRIKWNKVTGAEKYRVFYYGSKGWTRLADTANTSFLDTDVRKNHRYTYTVRCISADGKTYTSDYRAGKEITYR